MSKAAAPSPRPESMAGEPVARLKLPASESSKSGSLSTLPSPSTPPWTRENATAVVDESPSTISEGESLHRIELRISAVDPLPPMAPALPEAPVFP